MALKNHLPYDGIVEDYGLIFSSADAADWFAYLQQQLPWQADEVRIYGKHHVLKRLVVWYGDAAQNYQYSGIERIALPWSAEMLQLKQYIEHITQTHFNSCLANFYPTGNEGMGWHSDNDMSLAAETTIASLSFGASRKFYLRHQHSQEKISLALDSGQLVVMRGQTQQYWQHQIPKMLRVREPRINLTFRQFLL
jgi:alkylated DNA repair dioxygenase AlkB